MTQEDIVYYKPLIVSRVSFIELRFTIFDSRSAIHVSFFGNSYI